MRFSIRRAANRDNREECFTFRFELCERKGTRLAITSVYSSRSQYRLISAD